MEAHTTSPRSSSARTAQERLRPSQRTAWDSGTPAAFGADRIEALRVDTDHTRYQGWFDPLLMRQPFVRLSQPFLGSPSRSQWPGMHQTMRQVPRRHELSPFAAAHWTPHAPQFFGSSASTTSQALAGSRSQSAMPGEQFCSGCRLSLAALSAETVAGSREAQLPNPNRRPVASSNADESERGCSADALCVASEGSAGSKETYSGVGVWSWL